MSLRNNLDFHQTSSYLSLHSTLWESATLRRWRSTNSPLHLSGRSVRFSWPQRCRKNLDDPHALRTLPTKRRSWYSPWAGDLEGSRLYPDPSWVCALAVQPLPGSDGLRKISGFSLRPIAFHGVPLTHGSNLCCRNSTFFR